MKGRTDSRMLTVGDKKVGLGSRFTPCSTTPYQLASFPNPRATKQTARKNPDNPNGRARSILHYSPHLNKAMVPVQASGPSGPKLKSPALNNRGSSIVAVDPHPIPSACELLREASNRRHWPGAPPRWDRRRCGVDLCGVSGDGLEVVIVNGKLRSSAQRGGSPRLGNQKSAHDVMCAVQSATSVVLARWVLGYL